MTSYLQARMESAPAEQGKLEMIRRALRLAVDLTCIDHHYWPILSASHYQAIAAPAVKHCRCETLQVHLKKSALLKKYIFH